MAKRRYKNFDLLLEQDEDGQYHARVTASPLNNHPRVHFQLPFDAKTLELLLLKLDPGRSGTRGMDDQVRQQAAREFGGLLFDAIFTGQLALDWNSSLIRANAEKARGLRLRLQLDDAPALAGLPWELLYDAKGNAFPAQSERTPLVRFLDVANEPEPIHVNGPLRVLAIITSPLELEKLDVEREWGRIRKAMEGKVREGLVVVDRLPEPTVDELGEWLLNHDVHVIHFIGHGDFDATSGEGFIYFQDERGYRDPVSARVLGPFLHDHDDLRMVVLNACRSARVSSKAPYGGMAQGLVQQGATAVVAMQFPITDQAAVMFTGKFYGALAVGLPVDQAVTYARKALLARFRAEWATPVLFMRSPDGNIFKHVKAPPGWVWKEPPDPDPTEPALPDPALTDPALTDPALTDPALAALDVTDLDVTDLDVTDLEDADSVVAGWISAHIRQLAAAAILVIGVIALVVAIRLFSEDDLSATQMLVAAGTSNEDLDIYLVDDGGHGPERRLTESTEGEKRWLPVLSPDRSWMIYVRDQVGNNPNNIRELRRAAAIDGSEDRPFFDPVPSECRKGADRPAWIPDTEDLVLRCKSSSDQLTLVRVSMDGKGPKVLLPVGQGDDSVISWWGDPTVSDDGRWLVFVGNNTGPDSGTLYRFDLRTETLDPEPLLAEEPEGLSEFSDAVFSHDKSMLAWRAWDGNAETPNFEVYVATFDENSGDLGQPVNISNDEDARDQDPMFSPEGDQLVYGRQFTDGSDGLLHQELWMANATGPPEPHKVSSDEFRFYASPAWSRR